MSEPKHYFYQDFPSELAAYARSRQPEHHCAHCLAPMSRRCLVTPWPKFRRLPNQFRLSWYGITLIDQTLFTYSPEASQRWVSKTGGYPLPVEESGFGCIHVAPPHRLLRKGEENDEWLTFWLTELKEKLEDYTGVTTSEFAAHLTRDNAFGKHPLEQEIIQQLKKVVLRGF